MIVDITNEIINNLKNSLSTTNVYRNNIVVKPVFPKVTVRELSNIDVPSTIDSSGANHNSVGFQIDIYTTGNTSASEALVLREEIDVIMADTYGMERVASEEVPNYADTSVYRYVLRYNCIVNSNKTIYRG